MVQYQNTLIDRKSVKELSAVSCAVIRVLLYFKIFKYPLKEAEIAKFLGIKTSDPLTKILERLHADNLIRQSQGFYYIGENNLLVDRRLKGNDLALKYIKTAKFHAKLLSFIPFIKGIFISGSLSKQYMDKNSDIDYFIITAPNRLWIIRAIFTFLVKSLWFFKGKKYLCTNYIISNRGMEIKDKNIYTAIEIATLIPLYNDTGVYESFMSQNLWIKEYFPNYQINIPIAVSHGNINPVISKISSLTFFTWIDDFCFSLYNTYYQKKFKVRNRDLKFDKDNYKMHVSGHRNKILDGYDSSIQEFELKHGIDLHNPS